MEKVDGGATEIAIGSDLSVWVVGPTGELSTTTITAAPRTWH